MRKNILYFLTLFFLTYSNSYAQSFGNEWINYNQNYYKFKIYQDGIYKLPISDLFSVGLPTNVEGINLQLFRDGQEQPIYVTTSSLLSSSDYILFYGKKADGKLDKELYYDTTLQLNPAQNLISDTAFYFVTYNTNSGHQRYTTIPNSMTALPVKENYCWVSKNINYRNLFIGGKSAAEGQFQSPELLSLNLSQFQKEGYVKSLTVAKDSIAMLLANPYLSASSPDAIINTTVVGRSYLTTHNIKLFAGANQLADTSYSQFDFVQLERLFPMSSVDAVNGIKFYYEPSGIPNDRYGVSKLEVRYPSTTDAGSNSAFSFSLKAHNTPAYMEITNFIHGGVLPYLFNLTTNTLQIGDTSIPNIVRFKIPTSANENFFVLQGNQVNAAMSVLSPSNVQFKNFTQVANQGNFIIITDKRYTNDGSGNDYINQYKTYRNSAAGGSYITSVAYVDELYNEFGYGYDFSTLALKNFLHFSHTSASWANKPEHVLIIGKGLEYINYRNYRAANPISYNFYPIPTFGHPGSDLLLTDFSKNGKPAISIGRLSAFTAQDIKVYLDKVKQYELNLNSSTNTESNKLWKKKVLHIAGATDPIQLLPIEDALLRQKTIVENPKYGASAVVVTKSVNPEVEAYNNAVIDSMFNGGSGIVQFFGHSSASTIDYGLDFPERYTNTGKYPLMIANGCGAGNIFLFTGQKYLSERFLLTPNAGAIGFLASVNTGFSGYLGFYTDSLYYRISNSLFGKSIGDQIINNVNSLISLPNFASDFLFRMHTEQIQLNGDPSIRLSNADKPDYAVELSGVYIEESNLHSGVDSIKTKITFSNLGLISNDSVEITIRRKFADNMVLTIFKKKVPAFSFQYNLELNIPTMGELGKNSNQLIIDIDRPNEIAEISETNNSVVKTFSIRNAGLIPVYPKEFSIVSTPNVILKASTLNPFADASNYIIQIDTTEKFNSPLMQSNVQSSVGGILKWQPNMTYQDSVVYYWRTAINDGQNNWLTSSFIFINQSLPGWNQSHYFQFAKDEYQSILLDSASRNFAYSTSNQLLQVQNTCMFGAAPFTYDWPDYLVKMNGKTIYTFGCDPYPGYSSLQFVVIDSLTGQPWLNTRPDPNIALGRFNSFDPCRISNNGIKEDPFFEFSFINTSGRKAIMDFVDSIPTGTYVMIQPRLCVGAGCGTVNTIFVRHWKSDTTSMGSGVSLYHKLYNMGFTTIDSLYKNRPMILWIQKGMPASIKQVVGDNSTVKLYGEFPYKILYDKAKIKTPLIGPAQTWNDFKKSSYNKEVLPGDTSTYSIYGITSYNTSHLLAVVKQDTSLSFINPSTYPYLRVEMNNKDSKYRTPEQLKHWRIYYTPVPEAALNPASLYQVSNGTLPNTKKIRLAIENMTDIPMDSMLVSFAIYDRFNVRTIISTKRFAPLPGNDTIEIEYELNTENLFSNMKFEVEVNPLKDQLEYYHPNNIGIRSMSVIDPSLTLPITLNNFSVLENDCNTRIEWVTTNAENFSHFEIERMNSKDFNFIAKVPFTTSGEPEQYYTYTDSKPGNDVFAYRLKMVDLDQKFQYSQSKTIRLTCGQDEVLIQLYPNPANESSNVLISDNGGAIYKISIVNTLGQVLHQHTVELDQDTKIVNLPLQSLASGVYSVVIKNDAGVKEVIKLIKQ